MDASWWHRQAFREQVAAPEPATQAQLEAMSEGERAVYASSVRYALRAEQVESPLHDEVAGEMSAALESALLEPDGARTILSLSAPYSAGKSTMVKHWAQRLHRSWIGQVGGEPTVLPRWRPEPGLEADFVPVFYLTLLSDSRANDLFSQIRSFAGYTGAGRRSSRNLALGAMTVLRNLGARLVILDDAHMLRTGSVTGRATLNAVKFLNTELGEHGGVLMLVGAELTGGEALSDPQIRGRLAEHTFAPYEIDTDPGRGEWQRLLGACESLVLPYLPTNEHGLLRSANAAYLWARTQGFVGDLTRLVVDGTAAAITTNQPLTRALLDDISLSQRAEDGYRLHAGARKKTKAPKSPTRRSSGQQSRGRAS